MIIASACVDAAHDRALMGCWHVLEIASIAQALESKLSLEMRAPIAAIT